MRLSVGQHMPVQLDVSRVRGQQAGDDVDGGGFAAAGPAEQGDDARRGRLESGVQGEAIAPFGDFDFQTHSATHQVACTARQQFCQQQADQSQHK